MNIEKGEDMNMDNMMFRALLKNSGTNYYFLCGGTITEIQNYLHEQDTERADNIETTKFCASIAGNILGCLLANKPMPEGPWCEKYSNGLTIMIARSNT